MEVMNCRNCKRLFNYITGPMICPACKDKLEKKFGEVKQFIRENPNKKYFRDFKRNGCLRTAVKDMDPTGKAVFYG